MAAVKFQFGRENIVSYIKYPGSTAPVWCHTVYTDFLGEHKTRTFARSGDFCHLVEHNNSNSTTIVQASQQKTVQHKQILHHQSQPMTLMTKTGSLKPSLGSDDLNTFVEFLQRGRACLGHHCESCQPVSSFNSAGLPPQKPCVAFTAILTTCIPPYPFTLAMVTDSFFVFGRQWIGVLL
ncbi:unnamed protein product [Leuciscus chuanchicus]